MGVGCGEGGREMEEGWREDEMGGGEGANLVGGGEGCEGDDVAKEGVGQAQPPQHRVFGRRRQHKDTVVLWRGVARGWGVRGEGEEGRESWDHFYFVPCIPLLHHLCVASAVFSLAVR